MRSRLPTNDKRPTTHAAPAGFTLVELLVVIGIIALLVGILVPTVGKVRIAGQKVSTQATLNRISQGCEAYFQDFGAYPGPFSDDQLVSSDILAVPNPTLNGVGGFPLTMTGSDVVGNPQLGHAPSSSENLFLGLCGGLRVIITGGVTTFTYDTDLAKRGLGPSGLSQAVAKRSQSYFDLTPADISTNDDTRNPLNDPNASGFSPALWWPSTGGATFGPNFVGDSRIFEFIDRFSKPRPILYLRAQRGVTRTAAGLNNRTGFIYDRNNAGADVTVPYQYNPTQIEFSYANIGKDRAGNPEAGNIWSADVIDYPDVAGATGTQFNKGDERYFVNEETSTGNPTSLNDASKVLIPKQKDKFILISAGPDGLYGTADDIRN